LTTLTAVRRGGFSARLPADWTGVAGKIADTLNEIIDTNARLAQELGRVAQVVGREGKVAQLSAVTWRRVAGG
jgi:hypothetical protein